MLFNPSATSDPATVSSEPKYESGNRKDGYIRTEGFPSGSQDIREIKV